MCDDAMIDLPLQEKWVIVHVPQHAEPSRPCRHWGFKDLFLKVQTWGDYREYPAWTLLVFDGSAAVLKSSLAAYRGLK